MILTQVVSRFRCHSERSEESRRKAAETLRSQETLSQGDMLSVFTERQKLELILEGRLYHAQSKVKIFATDTCTTPGKHTVPMFLRECGASVTRIGTNIVFLFDHAAML